MTGPTRYRVVVLTSCHYVRSISNCITAQVKHFITTLILLLQTTTFGAHGGIPTYNRVVCRALQELGLDLEKRLLIMTDGPADLESHGASLPDLKMKAFSGRRKTFVRHLLRLALTKRIDFALIGHVNYAPLGLMLKLLKPRLRYGVMVHGIEAWSSLPTLKRRALQHADFVTSVSHYTKDRIVSLNGVPADRIYILPNSLECEDTENTGPMGGPDLPSGLKLLSVCRLDRGEQYKGVDTVIEALPAVISQIPSVQYYVIGDGTDLERHKTLVRLKGLADRVHFLGSVSASKLRRYYRACDVFVMPSAGEGFGIVYLEAMRDGKPVIAARSGAAPEVVLEGITGLLVEYGNKQQVAEALIELCRDGKKRMSLGAAGLRRLQASFTFTQFKENLTEILARELPPHTLAATRPQVISNVDSLQSRINKTAV